MGLNLPSTLCGSVVQLTPTVRDNGVVLDVRLDMTSRMSSVCRRAYYRLFQIAKIRARTGEGRGGEGRGGEREVTRAKPGNQFSLPRFLVSLCQLVIDNALVREYTVFWTLFVSNWPIKKKKIQFAVLIN